MRLGRRFVGVCAVAALAACGGGSPKSVAPTTAAKTTTTSPYVRPDACIDAMKSAAAVFDAQDALDSTRTDLDNALNGLAAAIDSGSAAKRGAAQAKVDAATQRDGAPRSNLLVARSQFGSLSAQCKAGVGARSLIAACQGVLEEATAIIASTQKLLETDDQLVDLERQIVTQLDNGNYDAANSLVDQRNGLIDPLKAGWGDVNVRIAGYDPRVDACAKKR